LKQTLGRSSGRPACPQAGNASKVSGYGQNPYEAFNGDGADASMGVATLSEKKGPSKSRKTSASRAAQASHTTNRMAGDNPLLKALPFDRVKDRREAEGFLPQRLHHAQATETMELDFETPDRAGRFYQNRPGK
jgi:hypothetical protein